ncbi:MAG: PIN domain-containing protein [Acidobacteriota bacterium]
MSGLVVDTSVWIDFLNGKPAATLERGLENGAVVLPPVVVAEQAGGAHQRKHREAFVDLIADLAVHDAPVDRWVRVGDLRRRLGEKGIGVSTPDAHAARCVLDRNAVLLSRDVVFLRIAAVAPLRLATD